MADPASSPRSNRPVRAEPGRLATPGEDVPEPPTVHSGGEGGSSLRRRAMIAGMPGPGRRLDTFLIREAIGVGGMGAVFLAEDTALERPVALKILPPEQSGESEVVQRFYQEARAAARLDHENIARVYTIGGDENHHYIAFEYIEGTTVRARVEKSGPLPVAEAINYTLQIAGALVHAAERGVVHRDIKPSNIIVTPLGRVKLVDMGLARRFEREADDGLTQSGMTLGTFDYISPEQARDPRDVDVRSDLYSLGCTLFHMLTGRPPFPDGTVLQKLLQHQEEAAPDVRAANPSVPADLAAILQKLMAKDRDRRHQTPEQLVRDLLTVAGGLGLRSVSPEGLVWLGSSPPRAWERHLVWGVPTLALGLIVAGLFYWSQPPEVTPLASSTGDRRPDPPIASKPIGPPGAAEAEPSSKGPASTASAPIPKEITIKAGDDLGSAIASSPSGSSLMIVESATFDVRSPANHPRAVASRDLVVKAARGASVVVKSPASTGGPTLRLGPGRVAIEGLTFLVGPADGDAVSAAISAEGTDLTIRGCRFLRDPARPAEGKAAALIVPAPGGRSPAEERPAPLVVERSLVGVGVAALIARAPSDSTWRDCLIGSAATAYRLEGPGPARGPTRLSLRHASVIAGDRPVFRVEGAPAIIRVDDSVIASGSGSEATLVSIDDPARLDWFGRENLYGRVGTFLAPDPGAPDGAEIRSYPEWSDGPGSARESNSAASRRGVWKAEEPLATLEGRDPSAAFSLAAPDRPSAETGARIGPSGPIPSGEWLLSAIERFRAGRQARGGAGAPKAPPQGPGADRRTAREPAPIPDPPVAAGPDRPSPPGPAAEAAARPAIPDGPGRPTAIRTAEQFREALKAPASKGRGLVLASDAAIELSGCEIRGSGRLTISAEPGPTRPSIRFVPDPAEIRMPTGPISLFRVRSGSLEIRGVDILLARGDAPMASRWGAFELGPGSDLGLVRSTLTIEGDDPRSAAIAVGPGDEEAEVAGTAGSSAVSVRISESLVRVGADVCDVAAGRRLEFASSDSDFASGGSLIHAHGLPRSQSSEPLKVTLRQVAIRAFGGLANLQSGAGEPELPVLGVLARDSILATDDRGSPLVVVDGQGNVDDLGDRVDWEGHDVAYHAIELYRRDQSVQTGSVPERFDLPRWTRALGNKETGPIHGDSLFLARWTPGRPAWTATPDDFRLAADSPAVSAGPALKVPTPRRDEPAAAEPDE